MCPNNPTKLPYITFQSFHIQIVSSHTCFPCLVSLRWDVHAASLVGAAAARPAAGALPAGLCSGSRSPVHTPLWSRVQQPTAPALPGHTGPTQWWVRAAQEWFLTIKCVIIWHGITFIKEKMAKTLVSTQPKLMETQTSTYSFCRQFSH